MTVVIPGAGQRCTGPPLWNVPVPPRPVGIARAGLLDAIFPGPAATSPAGTPPGDGHALDLRVVTGRAGVGKTQLAVE
ncbi:MAG: hypothetical protein H0T70_07805, partial [Acidimicrobiia bacterium]|nr:hypothetical protein [Acidimicrobiia bacterium]